MTSKILAQSLLYQTNRTQEYIFGVFYNMIPIRYDRYIKNAYYCVQFPK